MKRTRTILKPSGTEILCVLICFVMLNEACTQQPQAKSGAEEDSVNAAAAHKMEGQEPAFSDTSDPFQLRAWKQQQDSIRDVILRRKKNAWLKNSFLKELYVRDAVGHVGDSLFFRLQFDLHAPDCGAPDGYITELTFGFRHSEKLIFPEYLTIREREYGQVDKETDISGRFKRMEQTPRHVIYHCSAHKRTLVLFSSRASLGNTALYFRGVGPQRIRGNNLYRVFSDYREDAPDAVYPLRSNALSTGDYSGFLNN